ncbi:MAG: peptidoglycan DD-metalloendopeptidase family protein [Clostridia bacterium]|nr:peptidoglycan DD-metalloendopeptidase family protein [Clostridia bacterium]
MKEKKKNFFAVLGHVLSCVGEAVYQYHYRLGVFVLRRLRRLGRFLSRVTLKPRRSVRYVWLVLVSRPIHRFFRRIWRMLTGIPAAYRGMGKDLKKNPLLLFPWLPRGIVRWLREHREAWFSMGRLLGPVVGVMFLVTTIQTWTGTEFCLALSYRGAELGVIEHASVYDEAASMARDRVTNEDDSFTVDVVPTLTLTIKGGKTPLNASQVCDAILRNSGDAIAEATGLYIDGDFIGAAQDGEELQAMLDGLKEGQDQFDKDDPDQRVEFVQDVRTEEGLFPISTIQKESDLLKKLTHQTVVEKVYTVQSGDVFSRIALKHDMTSAELKALNPHITDTNRLQIGDKLVVQRAQSFLQVKLVKTIRYTETIDYKTQTVYRKDKEEGYSKTLTAGKEGSKDVVAEITYLDGFETERIVVSETVTKQPVTKVVEVGTKKVAPMLWPVPICHRVYVGYSSSHRAIDISSGPVPVLGKPAVAADSGTVIEASTGWNGGYGTVVKVRHSNGLVTVYAHLQTLKVSVGQRVTRGQTVGLIGNTGRSFGPHLHFEVIRNGVKVNPLNYVKP